MASDEFDPRPPFSAYFRTKNETRMIADVVLAALAVARKERGK